MYVADNYSLANITVYGAVLPSYDDLKEDAQSGMPKGTMNFGQFTETMKQLKK